MLSPARMSSKKKYEEIISGFPEKLTNLKHINDIVNTFKKMSLISLSTKIDACLAVDAIYFTPDVTISEDSTIKGINFGAQKDVMVPNDSYKVFTKSPECFESFIKLNYEKVIKAGFVFQIQPYNIALKPFVVHVLPSPNGKANENVISILHQIRDEVKKRNINIRSYAFDGDNAYKNLHKMYYESYINKVIKTHTLGERSKNHIQIVSDSFI